VKPYHLHAGKLGPHDFPMIPICSDVKKTESMYGEERILVIDHQLGRPCKLHKRNAML
jgi:hypothetical protein